MRLKRKIFGSVNNYYISYSNGYYSYGKDVRGEKVLYQTCFKLGKVYALKNFHKNPKRWIRYFSFGLLTVKVTFKIMLISIWYIIAYPLFFLTGLFAISGAVLQLPYCILFGKTIGIKHRIKDLFTLNY